MFLLTLGILCLTFMTSACAAKPADANKSSSAAEQISSSAEFNNMASQISDVSNTIPKNFKAQKITQTANGYTYSIYVPAEWTFCNGELFSNYACTKPIGKFKSYNYIGSNISELLGTNFKIINQSAKGSNIKKILLMRESAYNIFPSGEKDKSVVYELHYIIISKDKKSATDLCFKSDKNDEKISNEDAILKTIYSNTSLKE